MKTDTQFDGDRWDRLKPGDKVGIRFRKDWKLVVVTITDRYRNKGALEDTILGETSPGHKAWIYRHHVQWGKDNDQE